MKNIKPDIRFLNDIKDVLYDKKWAKNAPNFELYLMYRGLKEKNGLRYDITEMPPRLLGKEFVKTKGHIHIGGYSEVYIVLDGKAIFLMQKCNKKSVKDVYGVEVGKGEVLILPPYYHHITINPSTKNNLKWANWISKKCQSDYSFIQKQEGACYFYTKGGWVKNKNYKNIPEIRFEKPRKSPPKNLNFLKEGKQEP